MPISKKHLSQLRIDTRRVSQIHFLYILALAGQLIAYDAGGLYPAEAILKRWIFIGALTVITVIVWYIARNQQSQPATFKKLIALLISADIATAAAYVYMSRGMGSRAVILFAIPILVSAVIERKSALLATAILTSVAYVLTCVAYFVLNFNEGYKLELYSEVGFYSAIFIVISSIAWVFVRRKS